MLEIFFQLNDLFILLSLLNIKTDYLIFVLSKYETDLVGF